jgi:hypothetical protein
LLVGLIIAGLWPKPVPAETATVVRGPLRTTVNEEGKTRIKQRFMVAAPVTGQLRRIPFKAGAKVIAAESTVAIIDPLSPTLLDVRSRTSTEAMRDTARANLEKARLAHSFSVSELHRSEKLYQDKTISTQELEAVQLRENSTTKEEAAAASALRQAEAELAEFSIPDVSGVPMTVAAAAQLVTGPAGERIVALKVTEASYEASTQRFLQDERLARLKIVQGWDPHLARALREGPQHDSGGRQRCGVTSGPISFAIFQYLHILAAAERGDWVEVSAAQAAVTSLFTAMQDDPAKFADLQRAKHLMGLGQPLTGTVTPQQFEPVLTALACLPRAADRSRLAHSLDLMEDGPFHTGLRSLYDS